MTTPLRLAAFTQGLTVPSARFRVRQFSRAFVAAGVQLNEFPARYGSYPPRGLANRLKWFPHTWAERAFAIDRAGENDVGLFQREMISTLATVERRWKKPAIFDVDDAIWLSQRFSAAKRLAQHFGRVVCGNDYLAEYFGRFAAVDVIPTAVDIERFIPTVTPRQPVIVWSGSASGLSYLHSLARALKQVFAAVPHAKLRVISNAPPSFPHLSAQHIEFVPWSEAAEVESIQGASVGLMPMPDTPWTRGKCSYKMLTYMACGVPAVVSPYGMNAQVIAQGNGAMGAKTDDEWASALIELLRNPALAERMGKEGRATVEERYSIDVIAPKLIAVLRGLAPAPANR